MRERPLPGVFPPARQQSWCNPRRKRLPDGSGSRAQLWLRVYLVLLSPAVPPPSLETDWSNVSSKHPVPTSKLPEPRQATASALRLPSGPLSPPRASGSTASALWPEDPPGSPLILGGGAQSPQAFVPSFYTLCSSAFPGHYCVSSSFFGKVRLTHALLSPWNFAGTFEMNPRHSGNCTELPECKLRNLDVCCGSLLLR